MDGILTPQGRAPSSPIRCSGPSGKTPNQRPIDRKTDEIDGFTTIFTCRKGSQCQSQAVKLGEIEKGRALPPKTTPLLLSHESNRLELQFTDPRLISTPTVNNKVNWTMRTSTFLACLCLCASAFASSGNTSSLMQQLSEGAAQDANAAASFFSSGLAQMRAGNRSDALESFRLASQHSVSDARYWYYRFATETSLGETAAASMSLRVASTARFQNPSREKETLASISSITGNLRHQVVLDYLKTRLAFSHGQTAKDIIATALETKTSQSMIPESRLVMAEQSDAPNASPTVLSGHQEIAMGMLLGQEPIAGVTADDLASFQTSSRLTDESDELWANRVASGLEMDDNEVTWRLDACSENESTFQALVPSKIIGEILQKTASQDDYKRLIENINIAPNWVDCGSASGPASEPESNGEPEDPPQIEESTEATPPCCSPCPAPCARPAHRCFLRR